MSEYDEKAREAVSSITGSIIDPLLVDRVAKAIEEAVAAERSRCAEIVQLAREGRLDTDFRTIIHNIEGDWSLDRIIDDLENL